MLLAASMLTDDEVADLLERFHQPRPDQPPA